MGQKILVVEDNELNLKLFCDLLRAHGYRAEPVRDGREAVATARALAPDLIVMDIQMPHISGLELIEQIKSDDELKPIPIMAVTAYAARGDEERIRDAGAEGYVSKPISVLKFVEAVRALLDAAAARAAEMAAEEPEPEDDGETDAAPEAESEAEAVEEPEVAGPEGETAAEDPAAETDGEVVSEETGEDDVAEENRHPGEGRDLGEDEALPDDPGSGLRRDDA